MNIYTPNKKNIIITGHFGSGKTNVAVNLALKTALEGKKVTLIDLDIVNPYFRAADSIDELKSAGVKCIIPEFANTNVDLPSVPAEIYSVFDDDRTAIFDVGGDETGASVLGMFSKLISDSGYEMLYVCSMYRPLTPTAEDAAELLLDIEGHSRLRATGIVNNSNIGLATDAATLSDSREYIEKVCTLSGLPLMFTSTFARNDIVTDGMFVMKNITRDIGLEQ